MKTIYIASFELANAEIHATVFDRMDITAPLQMGQGQSIQDAFSSAMNIPRLCFESESDEREACVAAMRGLSVLFQVQDNNRVVCLGMK